MTENQRKFIRFILGHLTTTGRIPSARVIKAGLALSSMSTAHRVRKGLLDRKIIVAGDVPTVSSACFKGFRFTPEGGLERVF